MVEKGKQKFKKSIPRRTRTSIRQFSEGTRNEYLSLSQENEKLQTFVYALDQSAMVTASNSEGMITYVNDKFCTVSGYCAEELLGKNHRVLNSMYHSSTHFENL